MTEREHRFYNLALILARYPLSDIRMLFILHHSFSELTCRKIAEDYGCSYQNVGQGIEKSMKIIKNIGPMLRIDNK